MRSIEPGLVGRFEIAVGEQHTAAGMGNAGMQVLATPYVVWMMEAASYQAVAPYFEEGEGVAGTRIDVRHTAPTAVGRIAIAECRLEEVNGRRLIYACTLTSQGELKAEARYESVVVDLQRIIERANR